MKEYKEYARFCNTPFYRDVALENYYIAKKNNVKSQSLYEQLINSIEELSGIEYEYFQVRRLVHKHSIICVVFASMALEAYIYDYGARNISDNFVSQHLDKLDLISKWVIFPKLITGKDFPKDKQAYQLLKELVKVRNSLIHFQIIRYKSRTIIGGNNNSF